MATDIIARGMITEYIAGTNINFTENRDGTVEISASGNVHRNDFPTERRPLYRYQ